MDFGSILLTVYINGLLNLNLHADVRRFYADATVLF